MLGEEACKLPEFVECLPLLFEGVNAATVGFSLALTLLGVTGSIPNGLVVVIAGPGADEEEAAVTLLSTLTMLVEAVTVKFC